MPFIWCPSCLVQFSSHDRNTICVAEWVSAWVMVSMIPYLFWCIPRVSNYMLATVTEISVSFDSPAFLKWEELNVWIIFKYLGLIMIYFHFSVSVHVCMCCVCMLCVYGMLGERGSVIYLYLHVITCMCGSMNMSLSCEEVRGQLWCYWSQPSAWRLVLMFCCCELS